MLNERDSSTDGDAYAKRELVFPQLTQEMVERSLPYGTAEHYPAGKTIYSRGLRGVDFLLVLRGSVLITGPAEGGGESVVTIHGEREFTGELDLLSYREALVTARAATDTDILRIGRDRFKEYVSGETDIGDIVMRAVVLRRMGLIQHTQAGVAVVGSERSEDALRVQRFLARNGYPYRFIDPESDSAAAVLVKSFNLTASDLPVVISGTTAYRNPSIAELADALGITEQLDADKIFDVAVVGAGPAGLATAVYASSEGLSTVVIEGNAPGGQAGTSSRIENYLGFPSGISGMELASRAQAQAQKFGARLAVSRNVLGIDCCSGIFSLRLEGGARVQARSVVVATGAKYRRLPIPNYERFEMDGIHYSATAIEARLCSNQAVAVVGAGNSAGQAAMYLSRYAKHVHIVIRGPELAATMSEYLVHRILGSRHITLHPNTEIVMLRGQRHLEEVVCRDRITGRQETHFIGNVFVMIGADPSTQWLGASVELDSNGFVVTGKGELSGGPYRTSMPGIFAVGDVRSGSVKRVASGVGEGSVVVADIHTYLKDLANAPERPAIPELLTEVEETTPRRYGYSVRAVVGAQL
jgi:thioredoxin reductase (NADPH)